MKNIEKLQKIIYESDNIVFFGGAGVSTESGIKDFRGKNGIYKEKNLSPYPPEYMLSSDCLYTKPDMFFEYYKNNMNFSDYEPNDAHKFLAKLEECGKLKAIITQNIDGLHQKAGSKNVLEIHGTTYKCHCDECDKEYDGSYIYKSKGIPRCECGGIVRPNVVLYGEMLPSEYSLAESYVYKCDTLIIAGTSLTVEPAASLPRLFRGKNLVIINGQSTRFDDKATLVIREKVGEVFSKLDIKKDQ